MGLAQEGGGTEKRPGGMEGTAGGHFAGSERVEESGGARGGGITEESERIGSGMANEGVEY